MAITKFGVVCSTVNAQIRRLVYPNTDAQMNAAANLILGETLVLVPIGPYPNAAAWQAAIDAAIVTSLGKAKGDSRCVIIDIAGNVVDVVQADPLLDSAAFPGMTMINDLSAGPGWTWSVVGGFVAPPGNTNPKS